MTKKLIVSIYCLLTSLYYSVILMNVNDVIVYQFFRMLRNLNKTEDYNI